ncbi:hypothetical protein RhiJN_08076 [Ceratobasidium sp. AG-Ba]|nr:hypothetical protein RhiJN_08076 [Ceratobasidium sp. AG-Ba]
MLNDNLDDTPNPLNTAQSDSTTGATTYCNPVNMGEANARSSSPADSPTNHRASKRQITTWHGFGTTTEPTFTNTDGTELSTDESGMNLDQYDVSVQIHIDNLLGSIHANNQRLRWTRQWAAGMVSIAMDRYRNTPAQPPHYSATKPI